RRRPRGRASDPSFADLLPLDALEQRAEVPRAEPLVALALDDLEEERSGRRLAVEPGGVLEEDLQEVRARPVAVDEDLELAQLVDVLVDLADAVLDEPRGQHVEVRARGRHELDASLAHAPDGGDDVRQRERNVLDAVAAQIFIEHVDLRRLERRTPRLVVREL